MRALGYGLLLTAALIAPAGAADFSGLLNGGYDHFSDSGSSADGYDIGGAALATFGGLNLQGGASYQKASIAGADVKDTGGEGDLFWRGNSFSLGGTVRYDDLKATISLPPPIGSFTSSDHVTSYGGFAEYYVGPLTLKAKGGGTSGAFDGSYFAVAGEYYLGQHFAIEPIYSYQDLGALGGHLDSYGGTLELFMSPRVPIGIAASYAHSTGSGVSSDQFILSLSWRLGADRDFMTWDRTGPARWTGGLNL